MKKAILITIIFLAGLQTCKEKTGRSEGMALIYTNAQALVNCGPFEVEVYIDGELSGTIAEPWIADSVPTVTDTDQILLLTLDAGTYTCFSTGCSSVEYEKEFEVAEGECTPVFMDFSNLDYNTIKAD